MRSRYPEQKRRLLELAEEVGVADPPRSSDDAVATRSPTDRGREETLLEALRRLGYVEEADEAEEMLLGTGGDAPAKRAPPAD